METGLISRIIKTAIAYSLCLFYNSVIAFGILLAYIFNRKSKFWVVKERSPPKILQSKEFGEHKYATVNGVKLHYVESGDPKKPLMIFVHGFPEFWYSWRHQIKEFSKDYWTVAVDMRGYADSAKPANISDYFIDNMVEDIKGLVDHLGREKFILIAHDWGAVISWRFVTKYMPMVEKYVMIGGPSSKVWFEMVTGSVKQFLMSWYIFYFQMPFIPEFNLRLYDFKLFDVMKSNGVVKDDDIEVYKYVFSQKNALTGPINYYRANARFFNPTPQLPMPKQFANGLYMLGEHEKYISMDSGKLQQKYFKNVDFEIIKGASHFAQQDAPDETNRLIREFLKKHN